MKFLRSRLLALDGHGIQVVETEYVRVADAGHGCQPDGSVWSGLYVGEDQRVAVVVGSLQGTSHRFLALQHEAGHARVRAVDARGEEGEGVLQVGVHVAEGISEEGCDSGDVVPCALPIKENVAIHMRR